MRLRYWAILAAFLLASPCASAQQPIPPTAPKDRKDYLLEALEGQRNDAQAKLAFCYADANSKIAELLREIETLKAAAVKKDSGVSTQPEKK